MGSVVKEEDRKKKGEKWEKIKAKWWAGKRIRELGAWHCKARRGMRWR